MPSQPPPPEPVETGSPGVAGSPEEAGRSGRADRARRDRRSGTSPVQRIALGLLVVVGSITWHPAGSPAWERYDLLADPLGWLLVLWGLAGLVRAQPFFDLLTWPARLAAVVSVFTWVPQVTHAIGAAGGWAASLPQVVFCLLLTREIGVLARLQEPRETRVAAWAGTLVWGFGLLAVLPAVVLGGHLDGLRPTVLLVALVVDLALVWLLFSVHARPWLGGPGPVLVDARGRRTRGGRPPRR